MKDEIPFEKTEQYNINKTQIKNGRHICPKCFNHKQENTMNALDCKNLFIKNKKVVGQCCCYSFEHGKRR